MAPTAAPFFSVSARFWARCGAACLVGPRRALYLSALPRPVAQVLRRSQTSHTEGFGGSVPLSPHLWLQSVPWEGENRVHPEGPRGLVSPNLVRFQTFFPPHPPPITRCTFKVEPPPPCFGGGGVKKMCFGEGWESYSRAKLRKHGV